MARLLRVDEARAPAGLINIAIVRQNEGRRVMLRALLFIRGRRDVLVRIPSLSFPIYDEADIFVQSREDINFDHRLDSALFFEIGVQ